MGKGDTRNELLPGGIERFGRSAMYKKRAMFKRNKVQVKAQKAEKPTTKKVKVGGAANGGERVVALAKEPRYLDPETIKTPLPNRKKAGSIKLRASITPGTILILVSGPHRGRRVVFLKQLESGLLLVTGPFKINGVPLRRVNQAYVIATSTKLDISGVKVDDKFDDSFFSNKKNTATSKKFLTEGAEAPKHEVTAERKEAQKAIDSQLLPLVQKEQFMKGYLASYFTLSNGVYPHAIRF